MVPKFSQVYEELSGVDPTLLNQLCQESNQSIAEEAKLTRKFETVNRLATIRRDQELFIFHPVGDQGESQSTPSESSLSFQVTN